MQPDTPTDLILVEPTLRNFESFLKVVDFRTCFESTLKLPKRFVFFNHLIKSFLRARQSAL